MFSEKKAEPCARILAKGQSDQEFFDAAACREHLFGLSHSAAVVVFNDSQAEGVSPINLAAAICLDNPHRDVYLLEDRASGSLVSRARAAGIRGVINSEQLAELSQATVPELTGERAGNPHMAADTHQPSPASAAKLELPSTRKPLAVLDTKGGGSSCSAEPLVSAVPKLELPIMQDVLLPTLSGSALAISSLQPAEKESSVEKELSAALAPALADGLLPPEPEDAQALDEPMSPLVQRPSKTGMQMSASSIVGVFSGRGGVGKSTVSLLLALLANRRGISTVLVDADLQFGDIAYLLGRQDAKKVETRPLMEMCAKMGQDQGEVSPMPLEPLAAPGSKGQRYPGLLVLTAPEQVEHSELVSESLPQLIRSLADSYELILVNTSAFWSSAQACMARACTQLVFLMDQRAASIKACQRVAELAVKLQIPEARHHYVLNGCGRYAPLSTQDAMLALGGHEVLGLDDGGTLVDELLALGCPQELLESNNGFISSLELLLDRLTGTLSGRPWPEQDDFGKQAQRGLTGMLSRLSVPGLGALSDRKAAHVSS
ncbi:MAG: P-loop NTPase [Actinomycetia bacterium]|nr:P-loop NTPase [Actinomycetes bacterium]